MTIRVPMQVLHEENGHLPDELPIMDLSSHDTVATRISYVRSWDSENVPSEDVKLLKENRRTLSIFIICGLCPLKLKGKQYIVNEVNFTFARLTWFLWHLLGTIFTMFIKFKIMDTDGSKESNINPYLFGAIGTFVFILVDPVQTNILKLNLRVIPKILNMVRHIEELKLGRTSLKVERASKVYMYMPIRREKYVKLTCEGWLTRIITYVCVAVLFVLLGIGFFELLDVNDILDEWKFVAIMFYLPFPVLTTWWCVFWIGYQRKMYRVLTKLDDCVYKHKENVNTIFNYLETMQNISKKLCDEIYRFTFGINFCMFVMMATCAMFEFFQGANSKEENGLNGDIIYVIPIAVSIFHLYISCQRSTDLIQGQHDKLRYKLKGIMADLMVKGDVKQFKKVETLYKNIKDFSPMPQIFGGFRVNFQILMAMLIFIFTYARVFYALVASSGKCQFNVKPVFSMDSEGDEIYY